MLIFPASRCPYRPRWLHLLASHLWRMLMRQWEALLVPWSKENMANLHLSSKVMTFTACKSRSYIDMELLTIASTQNKAIPMQKWHIGARRHGCMWKLKLWKCCLGANNILRFPAVQYCNSTTLSTITSWCIVGTWQCSHNLCEPLQILWVTTALLGYWPARADSLHTTWEIMAHSR